MSRRRVLLPVLCLVAASTYVAAADTPLIEAVKRQDAAAVRAAIARHADVNAAEADGFTALHWAVQRDDLPVVELLLKAGADAQATTRYNVSPLYLAANNGNATIVERLL